MKTHINKYYDSAWAQHKIDQHNHRGFVGGLWEEIGELQFQFLCDRGLQPGMRLLDMGCGCFRGGVHLLQFLAPANYYGMDISQALMDAGYERELIPLGLDARLPRENLLCDDQFRADRFGVQFDIGMAQSLFTHLPLNHIMLCMQRLASVFRPGAAFYATAFLCPDDHNWQEPFEHAPGIVSTPVEDPYHYREADLQYCIKGLPWELQIIGNWGHPRAQSMLMFTRRD